MLLGSQCFARTCLGPSFSRLPRNWGINAKRIKLIFCPDNARTIKASLPSDVGRFPNPITDTDTDTAGSLARYRYNASRKDTRTRTRLNRMCSGQVRSCLLTSLVSCQGQSPISTTAAAASAAAPSHLPVQATSPPPSISPHVCNRICSLIGLLPCCYCCSCYCCFRQFICISVAACRALSSAPIVNEIFSPADHVNGSEKLSLPLSAAPRGGAYINNAGHIRTSGQDGNEASVKASSNKAPNQRLSRVAPHWVPPPSTFRQHLPGATGHPLDLRLVTNANEMSRGVVKAGTVEKASFRQSERAHSEFFPNQRGI